MALTLTLHWAFLGATVGLAWLARGAGLLGRLVLPGVVCFVGLFLLALARDAARRAVVAPYFKLPEVAQHPEWSHLALFLVIFLAGLGTIAYLVRLARTKAPA